MKIQFASDLHLELLRPDHRLPSPEAVVAYTDADVLVLAGDIDTGTHGVHWAGARTPEHSQEVLYVPGNHEFYSQEHGGTLRHLRTESLEVGVEVLDRDERIIQGVRFFGATLWTGFNAHGEEHLAEAMRAAAYAPNKMGGWMEDYRRIRLKDRGAYRRLKPMDTAVLHREAVTWLRERLETPFDGPTVVITHHAPSVVAVPEAYRLAPLAPAYWSPLEELMALADLWICGHTHLTVDTRINGCRLVSNPRGYTTKTGIKVRSYRSDWVVDL